MFVWNVNISTDWRLWIIFLNVKVSPSKNAMFMTWIMESVWNARASTMSIRMTKLSVLKCLWVIKSTIVLYIPTPQIVKSVPPTLPFLLIRNLVIILEISMLIVLKLMNCLRPSVLLVNSELTSRIISVKKLIISRSVMGVSWPTWIHHLINAWSVLLSTTWIVLVIVLSMIQLLHHPPPPLQEFC